MLEFQLIFLDIHLVLAELTVADDHSTSLTYGEYDRDSQAHVGKITNHVVHAESTNTFKTKLDKFWTNQDIFYDYCAEVQGPGTTTITTVLRPLAQDHPGDSAPEG